MKNKLRLLRAAVHPKAPSPIGLVLRGLAAGAIGAGLQSLFFRATSSWKPPPTQLPPGTAKPRGEEKEPAVETVARRFTGDLMRRGPLDQEEKARAGKLVHYGFGAFWGAVYALCRESFRVSPVLYGAGVWLLSDNLILPVFRLAALPHRYRLREHAYALAAHVVYGLGTAAAYAALRDVGAVPLAALPAIVALQARAWALRTPPGRLVQRVAPRRFFNQLADKVALA